MTTTIAGTARRTRRTKRMVGTMPSRSERRDMTTPCRQCGSTPTMLVSRGKLATERSCHNCGHIEYLDAPDLAL